MDYLANPDMSKVRHLPRHMWTKKHFAKKSYKTLIVVTGMVLLTIISILLFK